MAPGAFAARGAGGPSPYRPEIIGLAVLGLSLAGSSAASWWGIGIALVSTSVIVTATLTIRNSVRRLSAAPWEAGRWATLSITILIGAVAGAFVFAGSLSVLAVSPILSLACGVTADRCGARRETVTASFGLSAITAACVVFGAGDLSVGFSALVQGSVLAGVFVALLIATRSVMMRGRS
ncbi:hypothetical protein [Curtobacterium sp. DN_7.5]|uniref:hypothetical protein n=1 Tax=Curtobacterium sp. DN_7.5 TaxID=3049047 RepID=UPI001F57463C|nr:hypothetical protein [Curtobacterium sp. DN_7.5]